MLGTEVTISISMLLDVVCRDADPSLTKIKLGSDEWAKLKSWRDLLEELRRIIERGGSESEIIQFIVDHRNEFEGLLRDPLFSTLLAFSIHEDRRLFEVVCSSQRSSSG